MSKSDDIPIIDCHVHMRGPTSFGNLWNIHLEAGQKAANILSSACFGGANINQNKPSSSPY